MWKRTRSIAGDLDSLPHWARVAFAARCARAALPFFREAWPNAAGERVTSLTAAIELAERSAATAQHSGSEDAVIAATATAGAALMGTYGIPLEEPPPADPSACYVASFAAKVAEWSALAALGSLAESAQAALEAFGFVRQIAEATAEEEVVASLESDLEGLMRVAARGGWSDQTPVPASVFDLLSESGDAKPWWRFW